MENITGMHSGILIRAGRGTAFDVAGITIELLSASNDAGYWVMTGAVPAGSTPDSAEELESRGILGDQLALAAQHGVKFVTRTEIADYGFRGPKARETE
jgi:hypothetical protein